MQKYLLTQDKSVSNYIASIFSDIKVVSDVSEFQDKSIVFIDTKSLVNSLWSNIDGKYIVLMSTRPSFSEGMKYLPFGIKGYINPRMDLVHYNQLVSVVKNGNVWLYPEFMQEMICNYVENNSENSSSKMCKGLTGREEQIAALVGDGLSNKEIAKDLEISEGTVKQHLMKVFKKFGVSSRLELVLALKSK